MSLDPRERLTALEHEEYNLEKEIANNQRKLRLIRAEIRLMLIKIFDEPQGYLDKAWNWVIKDD